jgi:hypothetical protein
VPDVLAKSKDIAVASLVEHASHRRCVFPPLLVGKIMTNKQARTQFVTEVSKYMSCAEQNVSPALPLLFPEGKNNRP